MLVLKSYYLIRTNPFEAKQFCDELCEHELPWDVRHESGEKEDDEVAETANFT